MKPARAGQPRPRAVLYLRQSVAREESISLELQEHEGRLHAERHGYEIVAVEADPGISGRTWNRPAVQRVMQLIESGEADIIVLWKWSRLSRSRLDWAVAADRVETAGGRIESATEPLDVSTSTGRFARGMLTEFAAFESERIGDVWRETHARRIRNGLPSTGKPRFGYTYTRGEGFRIDPITGPVLADIYRRYIAGTSIYSLVKELNEGPTRPVRGYGVSVDGLWSDRTIRRVLDSGFGAGFIRANGELHAGAHEPIITGDEWEAYLEARDRRRVYRRVERSEYLLSGLIRCVCGSPMHAGQFGRGRTPKYRCKAGREKRTHEGGYVMASFVEQHVFEWLVERQETARAAIEAARLEDPRPKPVRDPGAALRAKEARLLARIDTLGQTAVDIGMPKDSYQRQLAPLEGELSAIRTELRRTEVEARRPPILLLPDVIDAWPRIPIPERRELLRGLIQHVIVATGRPHATFQIIPRGGDN